MSKLEKVGKGSWERSGAVNHVIRLLTSQFPSQPPALPGGSSMYTLGNEKLLESISVEQLQLTGPASTLELA